ncbi:uncharacterized protein LOC143452969 [Clavelina lepadiformis]|uniref:uncharacterized protein LOC143452969 n=1 Tax=Clavelina lepadiformis TaxID=159417 RepID=UPI00404190AB
MDADTFLSLALKQRKFFKITPKGILGDILKGRAYGDVVEDDGPIFKLVEIISRAPAIYWSTGSGVLLPPVVGRRMIRIQLLGPSEEDDLNRISRTLMEVTGAIIAAPEGDR